MKVTRTVKFQVYFPHARKPLKGEKGLAYELLRAQGDITRAANRVMTALWGIRTGLMSQPHWGHDYPNGRFPGGEKDGQPVPIRSLAYQGLSGKWAPLGEPFYKASGPQAVSSKVLLHVAGVVNTRLDKDFKEVLVGKKSLPTFRELPLGAQGQAVSLDSRGWFVFPVWEGRRDNRITVAPTRLRGGGQVILRRLVSGEYKLGDVKLYRDKNTGKWSLSVSWTGEVQEPESNLVAGLDLGIVNTTMLAYVDMTTMEAQHPRDRVNIPESVFRHWRREERERSERLRFNRDVQEVRTGRGRDRKLRVVEVLRRRISNHVDTVVHQTAAAVASTLEKRGVRLLVMEDLTGFTAQKLAEYEALEGQKRSEARKRFLRWHQGALRAAIRNAVEQKGVEVIEVAPAYTSKTCSSCGKIWTRTSPQQVAKTLGVPQKGLDVEAPHDGYGRVSQSLFRCSCGFSGHADHNAGINIARRGLTGRAQVAQQAS